MWLAFAWSLFAGGTMSDGDHELLYDRPIPRIRYLDWQAGVRTDLDSGPARVWGAVGLEGLAPYSFDIEPTLYVRDGGHYGPARTGCGRNGSWPGTGFRTLRGGRSVTTPSFLQRSMTSGCL